MEMQRQRDLTFGSLGETKPPHPISQSIDLWGPVSWALQILSHLKDSSPGYSLNLLKAGHGEGL